MDLIESTLKMVISLLWCFDLAIKEDRIVARTLIIKDEVGDVAIHCNFT